MARCALTPQARTDQTLTKVSRASRRQFLQIGAKAGPDQSRADAATNCMPSLGC
jgi:hypothetical protein